MLYTYENVMYITIAINANIIDVHQLLIEMWETILLLHTQ